MCCRSCASEGLELVLDLGQVPASDDFPPADDPRRDLTFPLELFRCRDCTLLQLGPRAALAPERPTAVESATAVAHATASVHEVVRAEGLRPGQSVLELDSGHGNSWLPAFVRAGLVAVEDGRPADLVVDLHHVMHEHELDPVLAAHRARMAPGGLLVLEFFHAQRLVEDRLVDTIRHGHHLYLSLTSLGPALARHGLTVTRATPVDVYGGSLRVCVRATDESPEPDASVSTVLAGERAAGLGDPAAIARFATEAGEVGDQLRRHLEELSDAGRRVAGYGAPSKAAVLLALSGVDRRLLPFTVDLSPAKAGRRIPGAGIPIRPVDALLEERPEVVVVLTWDIVEEVARALADRARGSGWSPTLHVPLPRPRDLALS